MNYTIVPMNTSHIPQVEEIERACFPDPWSKKLLEDLLAEEHALTLAAVAGDGAVLGYVSLSWVLDEGYINNVAVRPDCRRMGIATALLEALRRQGVEKGLSFLTLEVRESNRGARALYAGLGFAEAGQRRGYYLHPKEDAIIMTLEFTT
ncbi:MAG: ribosomal protein S18-alanine N-acetyltransferase [Oscillospiraceae bacterium]|nr:ribosomal protein S18-alanine N-acetyltransferase [Oscillospiraceae bacterium]MCI8715867.1 ribosomal protein S18-alanine N-acetyltransferase [Oscillospiraceae bacterium]